jgi:hypothetical protein
MIEGVKCCNTVSKVRKIGKWRQETSINNTCIDKDFYNETTPNNCLKYLEKHPTRHILKTA